MKGKCVPKIIPLDEISNDGSGMLEIPKKCTVNEIGAFAIYNLQKNLNNEGDNIVEKVLADMIDDDPENSSEQPSCKSANLSPGYFLDQIRISIDSNEYPSISDVEKVMKPIRLSGRKDVLIDILVKCFKMKGKSVSKIIPLDEISNDGSGLLDFTTMSKVNEIGAFAIYKLQKNLSSEGCTIAEKVLTSSSESPSCKSTNLLPD